MSMIQDLKLLSVRQVSEILNVSESTVRRLIHRKSIPTVKVADNTYRFHPDVLKNWVDNGGASEPQN